MTFKNGLTNAWCLDSFRKLSKKEFTYDNGRTGTTSAVSKIDKFMVSQTLKERGGRIEAVASVRKFSDHSPLIITIWGQHNAPSNPPSFFDISLLSDERSKQEMLEAWVGNHPTPFNDLDWPAWLEVATGRVMVCNTRLSKEKKHAKGTCVRACTKKIQLAEIQLQRDLSNKEVKSILSDLQGKLVEVFQNSIERNRHLFSSNWLRYGDTCSKAFFDFHRIGKKKTLLRKLETETGTITGQNDLTQYITKYYTRLYSSDAHILGTAEAQAECWNNVLVKVTQDTNASLTRDLTVRDILDAIKALPKGKAPGHDGVPMEFFHEYAEEVAPTLLQAFAAMLNSGATSASINKGLITLIPKTGDRARLNNWRPIILLGSIYKILAKTLTGRIQSALTHIIRPNQTGFVEGRSILDNVFLAQEALGWAEENEQDLVPLLLDFKKAFDRIEWGILFMALAKLGFSGTCVSWVGSLYQAASFAIKVNGVARPDFQLARSVRQGCPLAPYLFILTIDVLGHMMEDPKHGVEGLSLPKGGLIRDQTFANDTALYL